MNNSTVLLNYDWELLGPREWIMDTKPINKKSRIAIIGAGPAGLSTGWFLKEKGYKRVTILEKLGRIGGLSKSITIEGMSYDLGANYVTKAYTETLRIANEVGAKRYLEEPYTSIDIKGKKPGSDGKIKDPYRTMMEAVLFNPFTKEKISLWTFLKAAFRYTILRWKLKPVIDIPSYLEGINYSTHPELCKSFREWLGCNKLDALASLFEFPITIMGYGQLRDIPTPYALRYMSLKTFIPMIGGAIPFLGKILFPWPKRFKLGFQRMWEKVSWRLNVRLNADIQSIDRSGEVITIKFKVPQQELNEIGYCEKEMEFDYLILACPLTTDVFKCLGLTQNSYEAEMSPKILINPYCMTTYWVEDLHMPEPIAPILPLLKKGRPWAIAQQFKDDGNFFTQFYTRPAHPKSKKLVTGEYDEIERGEWNLNSQAEWLEVEDHEWDSIERDVKGEVLELIKLLGGNIDNSKSHWNTYDRFTYFQHVSSEQIGDGFFADLANNQGKDRTYYVGGVTDFELIEPIVKHSKYLVERHFEKSVR